MVSQFGSLGYTIMGRLLIWQLSRRQSLTPFTRRVSHKHSLPKKLAVHRVLYPSMLTESWVEGKSVEEKDAHQPRESQPYEDCQAKLIQEFGWTSQGMDWGWGQGIKSHHTQNTVVIFILLKPLLKPRQHQRGVLPGLRRRELDCCPVVQSPLFRWEQVLYFIWKPRSLSLEEGWRSS